MRKTNEEVKEKMLEVFWNCNSVSEFIGANQTLKESTAKVYWYTLCKEHNRKLNEKRGRKATKPNYEKLHNEMLERVNSEMEKAKTAKKSVATYKHILGE